MSFAEIRKRSLKVATQLKFTLPSTLPLLDESLRLRQLGDIEDRVLVLSAVVAASYGFPRDRIVSWLEREALVSVLSGAEQSFLRGTGVAAQQFQVQVEALSAFAWALGFLPSMDFGKPSPSHLVSIFPDFKVAESSARFRSRAKLRDQIDIVIACDLAYCLHWAINQAVVDKKAPPGKVPPHVVIERRRALEWMLSSSEWDDVSSLDT